MTIEIATPSSMEALAAMFDTLVDLVVERVLVKLDEKLDNKLEHFAEHELDGKIDEWAANFLQDRFDEYVTVSADDFDLDDKVLEIVQGLRFDIDVNVRQ